MDKEKVVILKSNLAYHGGLEKYTLRTAQAFAEKGCEVTILTTGKEGLLEPRRKALEGMNIRVVNFHHSSPFSFRRIQQYDTCCQNWLKENSTDVVFGMDRNSFQTHYRAGNGVHALYLQRRSEVESLVKWISFKINPLHRTILDLERQTFEHPELRILFANSHMVAQEIQRHYKVEKERIRVVHNGVEWKEMANDFDNWESQQIEQMHHFGLDPCCFQFLFVGNGYRRKGLKFLLEGLSQVHWDNFQLSVVGKDSEIEAFKALADQLRIGSKVKFFGLQKNIRPFYQMADVLVIPSTYDPFANVTLEALAMGLFVVSSNFNGATEILTPNTGIVIPDLFSREAVTKALQAAIHHPKTPHRAFEIRESVKHLDFYQQLEQIIRGTLETAREKVGK